MHLKMSKESRLLSSIVNEVVRGNFELLYFFVTKKFYTHRKHKKYETLKKRLSLRCFLWASKVWKVKQATSFFLDVFYEHKRHKNIKQATFFFLDAF